MSDLFVQEKSAYGMSRIYPVRPDGMVDAVQGLTNRVTLTFADLNRLRCMGINILCDHCDGDFAVCCAGYS
jgi:hypothetical protein